MDIISKVVVGFGAIILLSRLAAAKRVIIEEPILILNGTYMGYGNIYSPEIVDNKMYFSGWYSDDDYPYDAIYVTELDNIENVIRIIRVENVQLGDPSIVENKMYMTYSPDPTDVTKQKIAVSVTYNGGLTWSMPVPLIDHAWLPSAVGVNNNIYVYYTEASTTSVRLYRATIQNDIVVATDLTNFQIPNFYPINIGVIYDNGIYYLLGDYWYLNDNIPIYSIGMWYSDNGIDFIDYTKNPIIVPSNDNIIARTPFFTKDKDLLRIWFAQQKEDWWKNAIYYKEYLMTD